MQVQVGQYLHTNTGTVRVQLLSSYFFYWSNEDNTILPQKFDTQ